MEKIFPKMFIIVTVCFVFLSVRSYCEAVTIKEIKTKENIFKYIKRTNGKFDQTLYQQLIGAANPYKEGDEAIGLAADDAITRVHARMLLFNTKIKDIHNHPLFSDNLQKLIWQTTDNSQYKKVKNWTMGRLKNFLLTKSESDIKSIM
mmetsp:Transcript_724/g.558  ORF Transcript_724/g.558 Transcript_724/m.558 type:complete len:148 (-) Transcript_724:128-571(-)